MFLTSTSLSVCPVRSVNGVLNGGGGVPGPDARRLTEAHVAHVGTDLVAQHPSRLTTSP